MKWGLGVFTPTPDPANARYDQLADTFMPALLGTVSPGRFGVPLTALPGRRLLKMDLVIVTIMPLLGLLSSTIPFMQRPGIVTMAQKSWHSTTGNPGSWVNVVAGGSGNVNNIYINSFATFSGYLYAAGENPTDGAEVWRTSNGTTWTQANINGFGDADNIHIGSIIVFNNMLYASTRNDANGAEIWRSSNGTS